MFTSLNLSLWELFFEWEQATMPCFASDSDLVAFMDNLHLG
jgi:hypothetical protein